MVLPEVSRGSGRPAFVSLTLPPSPPCGSLSWMAMRPSCPWRSPLLLGRPAQCCAWAQQWDLDTSPRTAAVRPPCGDLWADSLRVKYCASKHKPGLCFTPLATRLVSHSPLLLAARLVSHSSLALLRWYVTPRLLPLSSLCSSLSLNLFLATPHHVCGS
jgi:hypothetical protein